jgi:hypothetical protein
LRGAKAANASVASSKGGSIDSAVNLLSPSGRDAQIKLKRLGLAKKKIGNFIRDGKWHRTTRRIDGLWRSYNTDRARLHNQVRRRSGEFRAYSAAGDGMHSYAND